MDIEEPSALNRVDGTVLFDPDTYRVVGIITEKNPGQWVAVFVPQNRNDPRKLIFTNPVRAQEWIVWCARNVAAKL